MVRLSATRSNQMQRLFEQEEIGDRTPSQFLRHMRMLAGESVTEEFLKIMWLSRLPQTVRTVTSVLDVPLDQLAIAADKVNDTMPKAAALCAKTDRTQENVLQIATTSRDPEKDEMRREWREFHSQMTELMKSFAQILVQQTARARSKSRQRRRSKSRQRRSKSPAMRGHCWYHQTFGDRSTKCKPPCNFQSGNGKSRH